MEYDFHCYIYKHTEPQNGLRDLESFYSPESDNPRTNESYNGYMRYQKCVGLEDKGKPKNIYTETYADRESERLSFPEHVTRESTKLTFTFFFFGEERQDLYQDFYDWIRDSPLVYWDNVRNRVAVMIFDTAINVKDETFLNGKNYIKAEMQFTNIWGECPHFHDEVDEIIAYGEDIINSALQIRSDAFYFRNREGATIEISAVSPTGNLPNISMQYSFDAVNWQPWTYVTNAVIVPKDATVYFRRETNSGLLSTLTERFSFSSTGSVSCGGNIKSLLFRDFENYDIVSNNTTAYCFASLFAMMGKRLLNVPSVLPNFSRNICPNAFKDMFYGCAGIVTAKFKSIPFISSHQFAECSNLSYLDFSELNNKVELLTEDSHAFENTQQDIVCTVKTSYLRDQYRGDVYWNNILGVGSDISFITQQ